jgi:hypothetical protein
MRPVAALPIVVTNAEAVHRGFSPGYLLHPRFPEDCNLPGVVKLVLRDPLQHEPDVVTRAGNLFCETSVRQRFDRPQQSRMSLLRMIDSFLPCWRTAVFHRREILLILELQSLPQHDSPIYRIIPCSDVQDEFPDTMDVFDRMRGRSGGSNVSN